MTARRATAIAAACAAAAIGACGSGTRSSTPRASDADAAAAPAPEARAPVEERESIGEAWMEADGTIVLMLRAEADDGSIGDALFRIAPSDPNYASILEHVGGLEPGQHKPYPPGP